MDNCIDKDNFQYKQGQTFPRSGFDSNCHRSTSRPPLGVLSETAIIPLCVDYLGEVSPESRFFLTWAPVNSDC